MSPFKSIRFGLKSLTTDYYSTSGKLNSKHSSAIVSLVALGGDIILSNDGYKYHIFTAGASFVVSTGSGYL